MDISHDDFDGLHIEGKLGSGSAAFAASRVGMMAFWILVVAIVGARATMFQPDPFASFQHQAAASAAQR